MMPTNQARIGRHCMLCTIPPRYARICRIGRVGEGLIPVIPRNRCADNVRYHDNGAGSAATGQDPCRRRRGRVRRSSDQKSARPTPRGGAGGAHAYMYR